MAEENDFWRWFPPARLLVFMEMKAPTRGHVCLELIWIILIKTYAYSVKSFFPQNSILVNSMAIKDSYCLHMEGLAFVCI